MNGRVPEDFLQFPGKIYGKVLAFSAQYARIREQILMEVLPMAYKITSACLSCGACADACPAGAISQGDDQFVIDAGACLDCGSCADTCPSGAIVQD